MSKYRDQLAANRLAERQLAMMTEGIFKPSKMTATSTITLPPTKMAMVKKVKVQLPKRGESDVLRECLSLLHHHPKVAIVERHNSGAADFNGRHVKFNRVRIAGVKGALISDITGTLKSGMSYAFECKEPEWKRPDFEKLIAKDGMLSEKEARELGQYAYLCAIRDAGGIGIFVTDVSQVINALETA